MRSLATPLSLCILLACGAPAIAAEGGKPGPFKHVLKPGDIAEDCVSLKAGQSREFDWTSNERVDFNIHWHVGDKVEYGMKLDRNWKARGRFTAAIDQDYCWMWTASTDKGAEVVGRFKPVE